MSLLLRRIFRKGTVYIKHPAILIVWLGLIFSTFWQSYTSYKNDPKHFYLRQIIGSGLCLSRGMASIINISCFMVIVPMCRCVAVGIQAIGLKFSSKFISKWVEFSKEFHVICACTIVVASVFHSIAHIINALNFSRCYSDEFMELNIAKYKGQDPLLLVILTVPGITGILMMIILCILTSSSTKLMRFASYDLFWYSHHLFLVFLLLLLCHPMSGLLKEQNNIVLHIPGCNFSSHTTNQGKNSSNALKCTEQPVFIPQQTCTWKWVTAALSAYIADLGYRLFRKSSPVQVISTEIYGCDLLELKILKVGVVPRPGQFVYLHCPDISTLEWHPFTVSKCPMNNELSFTIHMRTKGDWSSCIGSIFCDKSTNSRAQLLQKATHDFGSSLMKSKLFVDGPFGSGMENVLNYPYSILIAGGIGITPFTAILNFFRADPSKISKLQRLHLLWICREVELLCCFSTLLTDFSHIVWNINKPDAFEFRLYLTKCHTYFELKAAFKEHFSFMKPRLVFGRPKWKQLFKIWCESYKSRHVGVFCCGPQSLTKEIQNVLNILQDQKFKYSYYQESFS